MQSVPKPKQLPLLLSPPRPAAAGSFSGALPSSVTTFSIGVPHCRPASGAPSHNVTAISLLPPSPAGLLLALTSGVLFRAAQPALLYLVPCTLLPVVARAAARAELGELWGGKRLAAGGGLDKKQEEPEEDV